jgi:hypothetical protein
MFAAAILSSLSQTTDIVASKTSGFNNFLILSASS